MEYEVTEERGKFVIYSIAPTDFGGSARNYVAERDTRTDAEKLIAKLKALA